jgi:hypothetical protein
MDSKKFIIRETGLLLLGEAIGAAAIAAVFALLNQLDGKVIAGAIVGAALAVANFFFMAIASDAAADKAVDQDVKGGKATIKLSFYMRMFGILLVLFVCAKSGICNIFSMVIPLFLAFPILLVIEFFRKAGGNKK